MRKLLSLALLLSLLYGLSAQNAQGNHKNQNNMCFGIESLVEDLTPVQKRKLERLSAQAKKNIGTLKAQHVDLRDSITLLLDAPSSEAIAAKLFILYDREADIRAAIQKEYYKVRLRIDNILTDEQVKFLTEKLKEGRKKKRSSGKTK